MDLESSILVQTLHKQKVAISWTFRRRRKNSTIKRRSRSSNLIWLNSCAMQLMVRREEADQHLASSSTMSMRTSACRRKPISTRLYPRRQATSSTWLTFSRLTPQTNFWTRKQRCRPMPLSFKSCSTTGMSRSWSSTWMEPTMLLSVTSSPKSDAEGNQQLTGIESARLSLEINHYYLLWDDYTISKIYS